MWFQVGVLIGIFLAAYGAYKVHSLSLSGAIAAFFVGTAIFQGFGIGGLILLALFFGTSSFWSYFKAQQKQFIEDKLEKGSRRDWVQVAANGGMATLISIIYYFTNDVVWFVGFITTIASATGDTWSSEIGPLSKQRPFSVKSLSMVEPGTSGAVSILGSISAILGIGLITVVGITIFSLSPKLAWIILVFGIVGNVIDTYLGAYFQRGYQCVQCLYETEKPFHCGEKAKKITGVSFLNNDGVNLLASIFAPILAVLVYQLLGMGEMM
ncbi:DUF92 domain-containing protein [Pseudoneobacillus sp. C159]